MKIKIDFKSKKTRIIIGVIALAIILALAVTFTIINSNNKNNKSTTKTVVDPKVSDIELSIKSIDEKLDRVNSELAKVKIVTVKDNLTKYNIYGMDEYFTTMKVTTIECQIFNFVNEDIYMVKILPNPDSVTTQTYYYKNNEFTALDIESQGSGAITRYYISNKKVIAEKILVDDNLVKSNIVKMYVAPNEFANQEQMFAVGYDNYSYSKDESIKTQGEALNLANKAKINTEDTISFEKMEMIANKEYYVFKEVSSVKLSQDGTVSLIAWICIEKENGTAMYKDILVAGNPLITKDAWLEKNETIALNIYYPNSDSSAVVATEYTVNKAMYNKDIPKELVKIMNEELGLGINTLTIDGGKAVVDISTKASETKFDNSQIAATMSIQSLTKTIFSNTTATVLKVTVDGQGKIEGNYFSFSADFVK